MITRSIDEPDGIIQVVSIGRASRAEIDAHYVALRAMIAELRAAGRPIRVLSDQTQATMLPDGLNDHIKAQMEATYRDGDRVALLFGSNEGKLYARDLLGRDVFAVFTSRLPAEMWLMESGLRPPG